MSADEGRYAVCTDNGAIHLWTDDLAEAHEYADYLNEPDTHARVQALLGHPLRHPGTARVFDNTRDRGMVEVEKEATP